MSGKKNPTGFIWVSNFSIRAGLQGLKMGMVRLELDGFEDVMG
jgi:hypothetical protein